MIVRSLRAFWARAGLWCVGVTSIAGSAGGTELPKSNRTIVADVVALDQPFLWNRLGTSQPSGMIFALKRDVVSRDPNSKDLKPGMVMLRPGKRPRPLVLRMNTDDKLQVNFTNLLSPSPVNASAQTRYVGFQVNGLELALSGKPVGDGAWVGANPSGLTAPGETKVYEYFAKAEGTFLACNGADEAAGGDSAGLGLFGAVNVQPEWAEWYRSQVTRDDLIEATTRRPIAADGVLEQTEMVTPRLMRLIPQYSARPVRRTQFVRNMDREVYTLETTIPGKNARSTKADVVVIDGRLYTTLDQPIVDYNAIHRSGPRQGLPILKMLQTVKGQELFSTDPATFPRDQVRLAVESFNHNTPYVTRDLKEVFKTKGHPISDRIRITNEQGRAWLLTDPDVAIYLVEEIGAPNGTGFRISSASLHIAHSDLTAIITGTNADRFAFDQNSPSFFGNPTYPDRRQPYREFTIMYHQARQATPAFSNYFNPNTNFVLSAGNDGFAINYGMAGIGSEILAARLGVGPMGNPDNVDLKYEEFFLSSWAVGDPAMVVDVPANTPNQAVTSPSVANPTGGLQVTQQALFAIDEVEATDKLMAALNGGTVPAAIVDKFKEKGITIGPKALSSVIVSNSQWVILDPFDLDAKPPVNRARYPIVQTAATATHGAVTNTLTAYSGFPSSPGQPTTFNSLASAASKGADRVKATKAFFPDDPSNVYHSYIRDHTKFRILHAGPGPSHVHHLHAHQWLHSPDSPQGQYLDSQLIVPGATYTLEMVHDGTGNRNLTVGDSIFHCHFYPHFAQGMWSLWRSHDVLETGTWIDPNGRPVTHVATVAGREVPVSIDEKDGKVQYSYVNEAKVRYYIAADQVRPAWNRALPDGEIEAGTPIPAIVPMPSIAMPLVPAKVRLTDLKPFLGGPDDGQGRRVEVEMRNASEVAGALAMAKLDSKVTVPDPEYDNPGYPFFIPGIAGHRPPHPPMDFAWREDQAGKPLLDGDQKKILLDGGLPRHVVLGGKIVKEYHTRWDFTRDFIEYDKNGKPAAGELDALHLPEEGTPYERAAMKHHSQRTHTSFLPSGDQGNITRNGLSARPGAPYAPPEVDDYGNAEFNARRYQAAVIQTDVVLNKLGWHYPQQRFLSLWEDVSSIFGGTRPPQPLFFRAGTNDTIEFWHTNLVPSYYELDDFQVRTPTDVIGQHIHNVKFDVTSSDGGANGFNYEDGTFSPGEVRDRVNAIDRTPNPVGSGSGLIPFDKYTGFVDPNKPPKQLEIVKVKDAYPPRGGAGDPEHGLFGRPPIGQNWDGAQTTIQRWDSDPLLDNYGQERTLRTIFTHDHLGPSTHQQVGLYAGLVTEPEGSLWYLSNGERMNQRRDGGPTSWEGYIFTKNPGKSYREFAIEFQDTQLAYGNASRSRVDNSMFDPDKSSTASGLFNVLQYPQVKPENINQFRTDLDAKKIPDAFVNTIFPAMGLPLTGKETVTVNTAQQSWTFQVPETSSLNAGAIYQLRSPASTNSIFVYTPGITPGWSDPPNALNAPNDGINNNVLAPNNLNRLLGPPYPQLISSGQRGTYSMNYRNEPVISRLIDPNALTTTTAAVAAAHPAPTPATVAHGASTPAVAPSAHPAAGPAPAPAPAAPAPAPAAPAPAPVTIEIDGVIVGGVPTWAVGTTPAANVTVNPGDTIVWKAVTGTHGPVFDTQAMAEAFLQFSTGGAFPPLGPQTVKGEAVWGVAPMPAGTTLAQATVKASVVPGTSLGFFCSQHGRAMSGSLASPTTSKTIEVDGQILNGTPTWTVGTTPAANVAVNPGDIIVWKAVTGTHGPVFDTQAMAEAFLQFSTGGTFPPLGPQTVKGEVVWGVAPQPAGTTLAQATVKASVVPGTSLGFFCSQHGRAMSGSLASPAPPKTVEVDGQILNGVPTWTVAGAPAVDVAVNPGDTVVWKAVTGTHGPVFDTQALAESVFQFQAGGALPPLGPQTVKGELVWGVAPQPPGTTLAQATVKAGVAPGTTLGFFCSQHGRAMSGNFLVSSTGLAQALDPAFVFASIPRKVAALNVQPVPGTRITPPPAVKTVEIDGQILSTMPTWTVGTSPAANVPVNPGDTIVWKAVSGGHGVVFDTQALAEAVLQFDTTAPLPPLGPQVVQGATVWGTAPQPAGTVIARATVKAGVKPGTTLGFFCSQHGRAMSGSLAANWFVFPPYVVNPSTATDKGGVEQTDPFTPMLRAYANDEVQVRVLVGAHTLGHSFQIQGLRWAFEPDYPNSGFRNAQAMGISEHFEMIFKVPPVGADHQAGLPSFADYLVSPSSSVEGLTQGTWTMLRAFTEQVGQFPPGGKPSPTYLAPLPSNPLDLVAKRKKVLADKYAQIAADFASKGTSTGPAPASSPRLVSFNITATTAARALGGKPLSFNPRVSPAFHPGIAPADYDLKQALMFIRDEDLQNGVLKPGAPTEPLILRVAAGDWVQINLTNALTNDPAAPGFPAPQSLNATTPFAKNGTGLANIPSATNSLIPSTRQVGLHSALVSFDMTQANGVNVGFNPTATVGPGAGSTKRTFYWYAGDLIFHEDELIPTPVEYGAINLVPADMLVQPQFGMVGALIVEPESSTWVEDHGTHASATVKHRDGRTFRDFALVGQNRVANTVDGNGNPWGGFNYRTETFNLRHAFADGSGHLASDSQLAAIKVLKFETDPAQVAPLGPVDVRTPPASALPQALILTSFGTFPKPAGTLLAQAVVRDDVPAGTTLGFFCSQHGRPMSGSLKIQAAGGPPSTIEIDGVLLNGVPTWVVGPSPGAVPAVDVVVKPNDTVIWKAVAGQHGVVFEPNTRGLGFGLVFSNDQVLPSQDPQTPIFQAAAGTPVRFRLVMPSTSTVTVPPMVFDIHGHGWAEEPYALDGKVIGGWPSRLFTEGGSRTPMNFRSQFFGSQQVAVYEGFNFVIDHAGGRSGILGDYLYEGFQTADSLGMWGLFRVVKDLVTVNEVTIDGGKLTLKGSHQASGGDIGKPATFTVSPAPSPAVPVVMDGGAAWAFTTAYQADQDVVYTVRSSLGGETRIKVPGTARPSTAGNVMTGHGPETGGGK
jgi:plastocyanin